MKFLPVIILSVCLWFSASAQIGFKDLPISWKDFTLTDQIRLNTHGTAAISVHTTYSWESTVKNKKAYIEFTSVVKTNKEQSFVLRKFMQTADAEKKSKLLRHEQGHYLVALIKNLWLQQAITRYPFTRNYKLEIRQVCKEVETRAARLNNDYDRETQHSLIEDKQREWEKYLLDTLNDLNKNKDRLPLGFTENITVNL